ncbi:MAG: Rid family hydrolase [Lentisphaeria bacterium]|jgi:enamine deaminase RidA (YjgF/YER057c/UK114 family)|nr:Rid family hydrolase [Lentisphaeria bacterium]
MEYRQFRFADVRFTVDASLFRTGTGALECTLALSPVGYQPVAEQMRNLEAAYQRALAELGLGRGSAFVRRFFASDLVNQRAELEASPLVRAEGDDLCAVSLVRQAPLPEGKVAMIAYHVEGAAEQISGEPTHLVLRRPGYTHVFLTQLCAPEVESSYDKTNAVLAEVDRQLARHGLTLENDIQRTWFYVQNVDANYLGMVRARREHFARHGLTADTHFIASTGIEGTAGDPRVKVLLDLQAIGGLKNGQVHHIEARTHLNPTHEYGVTFERGTAIDYGDRRHVFISGTASIDNRGEIVHPGDVGRQFDRVFENIGVLLGNAGASLADMTHLLVYVRDPADYALVRERLDQRFGQVPRLIVAGPVCRPGWLIEAECRAIVPARHPEFAPF